MIPLTEIQLDLVCSFNFSLLFNSVYWKVHNWAIILKFTLSELVKTLRKIRGFGINEIGSSVVSRCSRN